MLYNSLIFHKKINVAIREFASNELTLDELIVIFTAFSDKVKREIDELVKINAISLQDFQHVSDCYEVFFPIFLGVSRNVERKHLVSQIRRHVRETTIKANRVFKKLLKEIEKNAV